MLLQNTVDYHGGWTWSTGNKFDAEEVEAIYELGDSNGDDVLDLGEFIAIMFPAAGEAIAKLRKGFETLVHYSIRLSGYNMFVFWGVEHL